MKDDAVYVQHMMEAIERIYTDDVAEQEFRNDPLVQDAVIRPLEIVGEAAKRLSSETREQYDDVPWQDISGMRDTLIHGYLGVDIDIVWGTIVEDVPRLKRELEPIRSDD